MSERKSRMMPEAFDELVRRANAGEDISGPFDLKTGRPAPMQSSMRGAQIHGDASMTIPQTNKELVEAAKEWRCFHCDEQFTDPTEAMEHFGDQLYDTPACQLTKDEKGLVGLLREAHFQLRRYQSEDSASYREFYSLGSAHSTALMREEEKGYARGLRDGRTEHPQPVTSELLEAAKEVLTGGNHLANFLIGKRGGGFATLYPPDTEPLKALELLGAGDAYDVWCCWAAIMKLRTALQSTPANVQEGGKP